MTYCGERSGGALGMGLARRVGRRAAVKSTTSMPFVRMHAMPGSRTAAVDNTDGFQPMSEALVRDNSHVPNAQSPQAILAGEGWLERDTPQRKIVQTAADRVIAVRPGAQVTFRKTGGDMGSRSRHRQADEDRERVVLPRCRRRQQGDLQRATASSSSRSRRTAASPASSSDSRGLEIRPDREGRHVAGASDHDRVAPDVQTAQAHRRAGEASRPTFTASSPTPIRRFAVDYSMSAPRRPRT